MKIRLFLLLAFITLHSLHTYAKKGDKVPAYIITQNDVKEVGELVIGSITDNEVKIVFFHQGSSKKKVYKPGDIKAYGYEEVEIGDLGQRMKRWVHYTTHKVDQPPKPFGSKTVFIQKEVEGEITLYTYYVEVRNNPKQPYRYFYYLDNGDGKLQKLTEDNYTQASSQVFKSYTALNDRIGQKSFQYRNLDRMVRDYNYWTVNKHDENEYRVAMKQ